MEKSFDRDKKMKKFLAGIAACVIAGTVCQGNYELSVSASEGETFIEIPFEDADINGDGVINAIDIVNLMRIVTGVQDDEYDRRGDLNYDGVVNVYDLFLLRGFITRDSIPDNKVVSCGSLTADLGNLTAEPGEGTINIEPEINAPSEFSKIVCGSFEINSDSEFEITDLSGNGSTVFEYNKDIGKVIFYCRYPTNICSLNMQLYYSAYKGVYSLGIKNGECFDGQGNRIPLYFTGDSVTVETPLVRPVKLVSEPMNILSGPGELAEFSVGATGTDLKYQWYWRKPDSDQWKACAGTGYNTDTLVVEATEARNGYHYYCEVTDAAGNKVTSRTAVLGVDIPLNIVKQPDDCDAKLGSSAEFKVSAKGNGLKYQWYWRKPYTAQWKACTGTGYNTDTLSVEATEARNGYQYHCEITDASGKTISSRKVELKVCYDVSAKTYRPVASAAADPVLKITDEPCDVNHDESLNSYESFSVGVNRGDVSYQWYWRKPGTTQWKACTGEGYNKNTLWVKLTEARNGYQYYCEVTDSSGRKVSSRTVNLNVNIIDMKNMLYVRDNIFDHYTYLDSYARYKVIANREDVSYQWYWKKPDSTEWRPCTGEGYNTDTLYIKGDESRNGYQYYCELTDSSGRKATSEVADLIIKDMSWDPYTYKYIVGNGEAVEFPADVSIDGGKYQWYWRKPGAKEWTACTGAGYDTDCLFVIAEMKRNGYQYYCLVTDSSGKKVHTNIYTLNVKDEIGIRYQPADAEVEEGQDAYFYCKVIPQFLEHTYQWYWKSPSSSEWKKCTSVGYDSSTMIIHGDLKRNGYQYYCEISDIYGCSVKTLPVTLTVKAKTGKAD